MVHSERMHMFGTSGRRKLTGNLVVMSLVTSTKFHYIKPG